MSKEDRLLRINKESYFFLRATVTTGASRTVAS
jgi:hypothetical protein